MDATNEIAFSLWADEATFILRMCRVAMEGHWELRTEGRYRKKFREESWEPWEVYLRQREQRDKWRKFSVRHHQKFWSTIGELVSEILELERQMEGVTAEMKEKRHRLQLLRELEEESASSNVAAVEIRSRLLFIRWKRREAEEMEDARDRLLRKQEQSEQLQRRMAWILFSKPLSFLKNICKVFSSRVMRDGLYRGPTQRVFRVSYPVLQ